MSEKIEMPLGVFKGIEILSNAGSDKKGASLVETFCPKCKETRLYRAGYLRSSLFQHCRCRNLRVSYNFKSRHNPIDTIPPCACGAPAGIDSDGKCRDCYMADLNIQVPVRKNRANIFDVR